MCVCAMRVCVSSPERYFIVHFRHRQSELRCEKSLGQLQGLGRHGLPANVPVPPGPLEDFLQLSAYYGPTSSGVLHIISMNPRIDRFMKIDKKVDFGHDTCGLDSLQFNGTDHTSCRSPFLQGVDGVCKHLAEM